VHPDTGRYGAAYHDLLKAKLKLNRFTVTDDETVKKLYGLQ